MQISFFYFSGTGNSKRVCEWFSKEANLNGIPVTLIDLSLKRESPAEFSPDEMIGFISPTHGFNYPPLMLKFILRFPSSKSANQVFLMNTRGGLKLSRFILPGFSGISLWLSAFILWMKGYHIVAMRSIDLPSNWISLHPGIRSKVVESMFNHYEIVVRQFTRKILSGKKVFRFSLIAGMPLDLIIAPVAILYYVAGRSILAKSFMATGSCDNCKLCITQCPVKAIKIVSEKPYWSFRCESCMRCINNCPKRAIEAVHGFLVIMILFINGILLSSLYFYVPLNSFNFGNGFLNHVVPFVIETIITLFIIMVSYRLTHFLKRYSWFGKVIEYTSLTRFKFWRRYKGFRTGKQTIS